MKPFSSLSLTTSQHHEARGAVLDGEIDECYHWRWGITSFRADEVNSCDFLSIAEFIFKWSFVGYRIVPVLPEIRYCSKWWKQERKRPTNFTASIPDGAPAWPLRDVKMKGIFASWRSLARRVDVFPVPPVRRIAILKASKYIDFPDFVLECGMLGW
jgi:hypothetical protein